MCASMGICMWARVCSHDGYTHMCPCGLGACPWHRVLLAVPVRVCPAVVCTPGAVQGVHTCITHVCVRVSARCACVCTAGAVWSMHTCVTYVCVYVCQCPLCLYVGDTCRAGLLVSLCRVCTYMLLHVTVLRCACALIPILGGSVAPGCPCKSPPLARGVSRGSVRGSLCSRPPKPSFALIPRPGCGQRDPSPAPPAPLRAAGTGGPAPGLACHPTRWLRFPRAAAAPPQRPVIN